MRRRAAGFSRGGHKKCPQDAGEPLTKARAACTPRSCQLNVEGIISRASALETPLLTRRLSRYIVAVTKRAGGRSGEASGRGVVVCHFVEWLLWLPVQYS